MDTDNDNTIGQAELATRLATMRAQIQDLERQLDLIAPQVDEPGEQAAAVPQDELLPDLASSRRRLLRNGAVALGAGLAAVGLNSQPAAAANGEAMLIGQDNSGTATTVIDTDAAGPAFRAEVTAPGASLVGSNSSPSGFSDGTTGITQSPDGRGVLGENTSTTGSGLGVLGITNSTAGNGVVGQANPASGTTTGVFGSTQSPDGRGVLGHNFSTSGFGSGVVGITQSPDGVGVLGENAGSGFGTGVVGITNSPNGHGLHGQANAGFGPGSGVLGTVQSADGVGVRGHNLSATGLAVAVTGLVDSPEGFGLFGDCSATTGTARGVVGVTRSPGGSGVVGQAQGTSGTPTGVFGFVEAPDGVAIYGENSATSGTGSAVLGATFSPDGSGVAGTNWGAGPGGRFASSGAAITAQGRVSVVPSTSALNSAPVAPIHVLQDGAGTNVELLLQLESDTAPQQTFVNNSSGQKWFFAMTSDDEFKISRAGTGKVEAKIFGSGNMSIAGTLTQASDANVKHDILPVDSQEVLTKVMDLPISTWKYDADPDVTHMGPTAQDFAAAFNLGAGDTGIATVDADGVAFAAIKALCEENRGLAQQQAADSAAIALMRQELSELRASLA